MKNLLNWFYYEVLLEPYYWFYYTVIHPLRSVLTKEGRAREKMYQQILKEARECGESVYCVYHHCGSSKCADKHL